MSVLNRLIIFMIRLKLHLKKKQIFQFDNQKTNSIYWFTSDALMKNEHGHSYKSSVSLNWLLDKECRVIPPKSVLFGADFDGDIISRR